MKKFIPLLCLLQFALPHWQTNYTNFLLQSDPLRRIELWRYFSPCLAYRGEHHLWANLFNQMIFGLLIESVLQWKLTALIYFTSILFGSLTESSVEPCFAHSLGAAAANYGLITAVIVGYMMGCEIPGQQNAVILVFASFISDFSNTVYWPPNYLVADKNHQVFPRMGENDAAHFGGALGGFVTGVNIWYHYLPLGQRRGWILQLRRMTFCFTAAFLLFTVSTNFYFVSILSKIVPINGHVSSSIVEKGEYEQLSTKLCLLVWSKRNDDN